VCVCVCVCACMFVCPLAGLAAWSLPATCSTESDARTWEVAGAGETAQEGEEEWEHLEAGVGELRAICLQSDWALRRCPARGPTACVLHACGEGPGVQQGRAGVEQREEETTRVG
jgi:hypothetical protein